MLHMGAEPTPPPSTRVGTAGLRPSQGERGSRSPGKGLPTGPLSLRVSGHLETWALSLLLQEELKPKARGTLALAVASASSLTSPCSGLDSAGALGGAREDQSSPLSRCCRLRHSSGSGVQSARAGQA